MRNIKFAASANGTRNVALLMGGGSNLVERSLFASNAPSLPYSQWYTPGNGSPAISTSDYYLTNGWYWSFPYDLDAMGSEGATVKAREGYRYVWLICADHVGDFVGSADVFVAYSNDPQVFPDPGTMRSLIAYNLTGSSIVDQNGTTQNTFVPYQIPFLVYNPDDATYPFYIYMEAQANGFQHELALIRSTDLLTSVVRGPAIPTTAFSGWTSYGRPRRIGVNDWEVYAFGKADGTATTPATYKYTSTDGWAWTRVLGPLTSPADGFITDIAGVPSDISFDRPGGDEHLAYWTINSDHERIAGPTFISDAFEDQNLAYPWQTLAQDVQGYVEDGIASLYVTRGYSPDSHDRTNRGPYRGNSPHIQTLTGSITSNVLDVTVAPTTPLEVNFRVGPAKAAITSFGTGTGGTGTYNVQATSNVSSGSLTVYTNGGLWQQFVDQYFLITDSTAAASAAPLGVRASCTNGTVTIQWNNCLPHSNYRVYRGTTVGTQATLIGDVTGTSITDTPTPGSQYFYKVVTMNSGEQGSRIVNVYASNNSLMYNKHYNRVINDGGDTSKIDSTFLAAACNWLTNNDCWRYVNWWIDVRFGIKTNGSGFVSKIYCLGTTYLPRGGDYTPDTSNTWPSTSSNTSYSATSFRGTTPSWINNASSAHGYFGNGRYNNIQRWNEITLIAAYQKPGTAAAGLFGYGEFDGMYLRHDSGSSGNITFAMSAAIGGANAYTTATVAFASATAAHVAAGTLDSSGNMTAYLDGVAGTPVSTAFANPNMTGGSVLQGSFLSSSDGPPTNRGTGTAVLSAGGTTGSRKPNYSISNEALYTGAGQAVFNKGLSSSLIASWGALYA